MKRTTILAIVLLPLLASCGPEADTPMAVTKPGPTVTPEDTYRIQVSRIGVIPDDIAYNNKRGIYVITDRQTGREYIGVSGVGITEVGSHRNGKSTVTDER
jgi:hypothetical protein